ncbi:MAG: hypothetical protein AABZ44_02645, partial [Elusimicrobiota bacterium]
PGPVFASRTGSVFVSGRADKDALNYIADSRAGLQPTPMFFVVGPKRTDDSVKLTSGFGKSGTRPHHGGLDIEAPNGSMAINRLPGTVVWAGYRKASVPEGANEEQKRLANNDHGLGNMVVVELTDGSGLLIYHHFGDKIKGEDKQNSGLLVSAGQELKPGDPIGFIGNTGAVTKTVNGKNVNCGNTKSLHKDLDCGRHLHASWMPFTPKLKEEYEKVKKLSQAFNITSFVVKHQTEYQTPFKKIWNIEESPLDAK